ncbi:hypothetical protein BC835DRAFT_1413085 [Cytidiella melzeri]|nr:hypothetical protein BC835DRAFT_1413085 [Cytidiella melzeri]
MSSRNSLRARLRSSHHTQLTQSLTPTSITYDLQEATESCTALTRHWSSALGPESPFSAQRQYAPPPGPPPNWEAAFGLDPDVSRRQSTSRQRGTERPEPKPRILSHDEEVQRLLKVCSSAKGNAQLLRETLAYTNPEELAGNELVVEFRKKCRQSQKFIATTIPWATTAAEQSRTAAAVDAETNEEALLAQLLAANEEVVEAIKMYQQAADGVAESEQRNKKKAEGKLRALDAITSFEPTPPEASLVDLIFEIGDPHGRGGITTEALHKILGGSRLPPQTLNAIFDIANVEENEMFSKHCVGVAVRLIGHAQIGVPIVEDLVIRAGPLATIDGLEASRTEVNQNHATSSTSAATYHQPTPGFQTENLPALTSEDRQKFMKIFNGSQPTNGVIDGARARELFMRSQLSSETLGKIWDLADTSKRGALDAPAFTIAMYLIQACMAGTLASVPSSLPQHLYSEAGFVVPPSAFALHFASGSSSSTQPQSPAWDVPADVRSSADAFFDVFDEQRQGYLSRDVIQEHLKQTGLPQETLQRIWDLSDMNTNGRLSREEFAVAMSLIQMAERREPLPAVLPTTLVPPTHRPPVVSVQSVTADLIGLDFTDEPSTSGLGRPITPTSSPPPLPPRSPMSPTSSSYFKPLPSESSSMPSTRSGSTAPAQSGSSTHPAGWTWDVSIADKSNSDRFFETLDPWKAGFIEGDAAVGFMAKSKLPSHDLGRIWDLADIDQDGRLTREEFAVAMHLIRAKLAGGDIPETLPASLVPPANLATLPEHNATLTATTAPGPPLPPRPAGSTSNPPTNPQEARTGDAEVVSPLRSSTPPPPYEEPNAANIFSS